MGPITLDSLIETGDSILKNEHIFSYRRYVDNEQYTVWKHLSLMYLQEHFPHHPQTKTFQEKCASDDNSVYRCLALVSILRAFQSINPSKEKETDYHKVLETIFTKFHTVARQLRRRHSGRVTLEIKDEYDVQDLLHALLKLFIDDVRTEEWTPSYAGGCKRMDFLLKEEEIAIETKMARENLRDKELGEQLIIDVANYKEHPNCKQLYCFIYDPEGIIHNPYGLEKDLSQSDGSFDIFVFIMPRT